MLVFIKNNIFRILSFLLILIVLVLSTPNFLQWRLKQNDITEVELALSKVLVNQAYNRHFSSKKFFGSKNWILANKELATTNAENAFALSLYYLAQNKTRERLHWLNKAARLSHEKAKYILAHISYQASNFKNTKRYLKGLKSAQAFELKIRLAMKEGDINTLTALNNSALSAHLALQEELANYISLETNLKPKQCQFPIQFFATNLEDLRKIKSQTDKIDQSKFANLVCFNQVKYIDVQSLDCLHKGAKAISCNESIWQNVAISKNTYYLAVVVPKGGANVHHGILYLDSNDNLDVLNHELAHLLGFIDEYSLIETHDICQTNQLEPFSFNVAVLRRLYQGKEKEVREQILSQISWRKMISKDTPIMTKTDLGWLVGTPKAASAQYALYESETCMNDELISVKPIKSGNMMMYNELAFPTSYQMLLKEGQGKFSMPSYHFNIALALSQKDNNVAARIWLKKSISAKNNANF